MNKIKAYAIEHWNGKFSLSHSYWLNSVIIATVITLIFAFAIGFILGASATMVGAAMPSSAVCNFLGTLASIPVLVWSLTGTWRSAEAYNAARPDSSFTWGSLAKIAICLGVLRTVLYFIGTFMLIL